MNRPYIIGKAAFSLDGYMSRPGGDDQWISSAESRADANRLRADVDAIMIGAGTARADNPHLTVRTHEVPLQPWRIVLSRSGHLSPDLHLFTDAYRDRTVVINPIDWTDLWNRLGQLGIKNLLVEGGGSLLNQLAENGFIDEAIYYYAPFNLDDPDLVSANAFRELVLDRSVTFVIGPDIKIQGRVARPDAPGAG